MASEPVLLLTATIDPKGCYYLKRRSVSKRLVDYEAALSRWIESGAVSKIIWCENSGYCLDSIHDIVNATSRQRRQRIRVQSFEGNTYPRRLGKGFGEMGIISHAMSTNPARDPHQLIIKVTGRYYVSNLPAILAAVEAGEHADIVCNLNDADQTADSRCFLARREFITAHLLPRHSLINDSKGVYFEHVLAAAVLSSVKHGLRWRPFPAEPRIEGISGTLNLPYATPALR